MDIVWRKKPSGYERRKQFQHAVGETEESMEVENIINNNMDAQEIDYRNNIDMETIDARFVHGFKPSSSTSTDESSTISANLFTLEYSSDQSGEGDDLHSSSSSGNIKLDYSKVDDQFKAEFIKNLQKHNKWASKPTIPEYLKVPSFKGSKINLFEHLMLLLEERVKGNSWVSIKREIRRLELSATDLNVPLSIKKLKQMLGEAMLPSFNFVTCENGI